MRTSAVLALALAAAGLLPGCVTRRMLITSDPPGAMVYYDGQPIGPTPVDRQFVFYGKYRFRFEKDGFAPGEVVVDLDTPWYQYPGIDLFFENFFPFTLRDTQPVHCVLQPLEAPRPEEVRGSAEALRLRGEVIGVPKGTPRLPKPPKNPPVISPSPQAVPSPAAP